MSIDAYEQMSTCVFDIISIALVTLEMIYNTLLINALRFLFACRELLDNLATHKHWQDADWSFILRSLNCFFTISRLLVFKGYNDPISVFCRRFRPQWRLVSDSWMCFISFQVWPVRYWLCRIHPWTCVRTRRWTSHSLSGVFFHLVSSAIHLKMNLQAHNMVKTFSPLHA